MKFTNLSTNVVKVTIDKQATEYIYRLLRRESSADLIEINEKVFSQSYRAPTFGLIAGKFTLKT